MSLLKSKKFLVSIAGVLSVVLMHYVNIPEETSMKVFGIIISFVVGQGLADIGKEKAKIEKGEK